MDLVVFIIILMASLGITLIVYALNSKKKTHEEAPSSFNLENTVKTIDNSLTEADKAAEELSDLSKNIFQEFEGKYQELLFLYNLIDEKKKEIMSSGEKTEHEAYESAVDLVVSDSTPRMKFKNPKLKEIMELKKSGMSDENIAKSLNMGSGEVKLIMGLHGLSSKGKVK